jgi:hypothetical protein
MQIIKFGLWAFIFFIVFLMLIDKSNDLDFYKLGYDQIFNNSISDLDLFYFYLTDSFFFYFIKAFSFILNIEGEFIITYFGFFLGICKLIAFQIRFKNFASLIIFLYLINFFYLFEINQLRESLVISIFLFLPLITFSFLPILILTFFHKSAFIFFLAKQKLNFKIIILLFVSVLFLFFFIKPFFDNKWVDSNDSLNVLTINLLMYLTYFYVKVFTKNNFLNEQYFILICFSFLSFFLFKSISTVISIRIYELGIFFILLSFPPKLTLTKSNIYFYISWIFFSVYNFYFIFNKYS